MRTQPSRRGERGRGGFEFDRDTADALFLTFVAAVCIASARSRVEGTRAAMSYWCVTMCSCVVRPGGVKAMLEIMRWLRTQIA